MIEGFGETTTNTTLIISWTIRRENVLQLQVFLKSFWQNVKLSKKTVENSEPREKIVDNPRKRS